VLIAGGGPTGMMLAGELALAGVDVAIVERRGSHELDGSRAGGLHSRTIEVLDQRGIAGRFLAAGRVMPQLFGFVGIAMDLGDFPTRHPYVLALRQQEIERLLAGWVEELGVPIHRHRDVVGLIARDDEVVVELADGATMRGQYLVGCDGGRSVVRKAAGIDFAGWDATTGWLIAEVEMTEQPAIGMRREGGGVGPVDPARVGGPYRVVLTQPFHDDAGEPTLSDLRGALVAAYGTDFGAHSPTWISRFSDMTRQAVSYRRGRVLLAGDAAHVHPPQGGQGLNVGVQDAVNLGWKLAQVVRGASPDSLLDTYDAERHPVAARVLHNTMAQAALGGVDDRHQALRDFVTEWLAMDEPRRRVAGMLSGLDIDYDLGGGHPLVGRRMPDLDLVVAGAPTRVYELLRSAEPVLLDLGGSDGGPPSPIRTVRAIYDGVWELPVIGEVDAPPAVLIRPDGHVAWAGTLDDPGLSAAIATWFAHSPGSVRRTV